jgi:large subunit ribosomal protein L6
MPIIVPSGVAIDVADDSTVTVKGPLGTLSRQLDSEMTLHREDGVLTVTRPSDEQRHRAMHGLTRSLVSNMVTGVTTGYTKSLQISGVGYRAQVQGDKLVLQVGFSHPVEMVPPTGITYAVEPVQTPRGAESRVHVRGIDKQLVGEIAAKVRSVRPPEPYLGKGIRYVDEVIRRKVGKAGKAGGKKK